MYLWRTGGHKPIKRIVEFMLVNEWLKFWNDELIKKRHA